MTAPSDFLAAALAYAARRTPVFPLWPRDKTPLIGKRFGGRGVLDATCDAAQIRRWWDIRPDANIGIATGAPSGFFAVDVDPGKGGDETLAELEQKHGPLPASPVSHTGGGRHILFRQVEGLRNSAGALGPGLDVRADGGYICAPPSIHPNGRAYAWDLDYHFDDLPVAAAPAWLLELLEVKTKDSANNGARMPEFWRALVRDGVEEGHRNDKLAKLAGHLLRRGVDPFVTLDLCRCWNAQRCRPPLDDAEVVRTVDSIAAAERRRREEQE